MRIVPARIILLSLGMGVASNAGGQQPRPVTYGTPEGIGKIIEGITSKYVDPVDKTKLVARCSEGMLRLANKRSDPPQPAEESSVPRPAIDEIAEVFRNIKQQNPGAVEEKALAVACIRGMLAGLDRRSVFLDEDEFKELLVGSSPLGGIGIDLRVDSDFPRIVAPSEGGPAERAGLKTSDTIVKIDSASTRGVSLIEVVKRLRGPEGSTITLTVEREGAKELLEFPLTREVIRVQSVKWKSVAPGYAYIRVSQFAETTVALLARAIESSYRENQGGVKGLILDLRNNPGGLLNACIAVSAAFLPRGSLVVFTDGHSEDAKRRFLASPEDYLRGRNSEDYLSKLPKGAKTVPMVVLVNRGAASGSEIVAAALQFHTRAKILGARTAGQGSIQTILPLGDNAGMKLTSARLYSPSGRGIEPNGVTPDVMIEQGVENSALFGSAEDSQLNEALRVLGARQ
jgi:carboxyl-terminal processing protease